MKTYRISIGILLANLLIICQPAIGQFPAGSYLGQPLPGHFPEQFAPGLLPDYTSGITFSPDGLECFSTRWYPNVWSFLMTTKEQGGGWPAFDTASLTVDMDESPYLTPDGNRLYYIRFTPIPPSTYYVRHLTYSDRIGSSWTSGVTMGSPLFEHYIISVSSASNGNLYLGIADNNDPAIYVSKFVNGNYQEPEKLSDSINACNRPLRPHISPDESFVLFDAGETPDPFSQRDLYISYRKQDATWTKAVPFSNTVNTGANETTPFLSRDGRYLFFQRDAITMWMDSTNIPMTGLGNDLYVGMTLQLNQNFPNPCRGTTTIGYYLEHAGQVSLCLYNALQEEVAVLANEKRFAGRNEVSFNTGDLPAGVYVYVLRTQDGVLTRKLICTK